MESQWLTQAEALAGVKTGGKGATFCYMRMIIIYSPVGSRYIPDRQLRMIIICENE